MSIRLRTLGPEPADEATNELSGGPPQQALVIITPHDAREVLDAIRQSRSGRKLVDTGLEGRSITGVDVGARPATAAIDPLHDLGLDSLDLITVDVDTTGLHNDERLNGVGSVLVEVHDGPGPPRTVASTVWRTIHLIERSVRGVGAPFPSPGRLRVPPDLRPGLAGSLDILQLEAVGASLLDWLGGGPRIALRPSGGIEPWRDRSFTVVADHWPVGRLLAGLQTVDRRWVVIRSSDGRGSTVLERDLLWHDLRALPPTAPIKRFLADEPVPDLRGVETEAFLSQDIAFDVAAVVDDDARVQAVVCKLDAVQLVRDRAIQGALATDDRPTGPVPSPAVPLGQQTVSYEAPSVLDLDDGADDEVSVVVGGPLGADGSARGHARQPIAFSTRDRIDLDVSLRCVDHRIDIVERSIRRVVLNSTGEATAISFPIRARAIGSSVLVLEVLQGGLVLLALPIPVVVDRERRSDPHGQGQRLSIEPDADGSGWPSLVVTRRGPESRQLDFVLRDGRGRPIEEATSLMPSEPLQFLEQLENHYLDAVSDSRPRDFVGVGRQLAAALPEAVLDAVRDAAWPRESLILQSLEIHQIPWELAHVDDRTTREPVYLGQYGAVRGLRPYRLGPTAHLRGDRSVAACIEYRLDAEPLDQVEREEAILRHRGFRILPKADRGALVTALRAADYDVFHYAGHASSDRFGDVLELEASNGALETVERQDLDGLAFGDRNPIVFLNGCRTGVLQAKTTDDLDGWARLFMEAGARAFIGNHYPVEDKSALDFADRFYSRLLDEATETSLGEIVRDLRSVDDPLAGLIALGYVVYGHPSQRFAPVDKPQAAPGRSNGSSITAEPEEPRGRRRRGRWRRRSR